MEPLRRSNTQYTNASRQQGEAIIARRTESIDASSITKLAQPSSEALFGRVNVVSLIEKAVLAVTLSNVQDEIIAHAAFLDYPNVPGANIDKAAWEEWLSTSYPTDSCNAINTLFLHYFVAVPEYSHGCAQEIVRTLFNAVPQVHYCFLVVPSGVYPEAALADIFNPMKTRVGVKQLPNCAVFACLRHEHMPVLYIRPAKVEDHDDLVPIFNRQSNILQRTYGDYFLSDVIESEDENMRTLVAEVNGLAVGFMSISKQVNYDLLNDCFELKSFQGLHAVHPEDIEESLTSIAGAAKPDEPARPITADRASMHSITSAHGEDHRQLDEEEDAEEEEEIYDGEADSLSGASNAGARIRLSETSVEHATLQDSTTAAKAMQAAEKLTMEMNASDYSMKSRTSSWIKCQSSEGKVYYYNAETRQTSSALPRGDSGRKGGDGGTPKTSKPPTPDVESQQQTPVYKGPPAAFCIQLFCIDEQFEMRSADFLPKAFELFPDMDYCISTVPHLVPQFPLLHNFVRATPKSHSTLPQELYIFHKHGLAKDFRVRPAREEDGKHVQKLVKSVNLHANLLNDLQQYFKSHRDDDGTELQAFVAESSHQIVGIAIMRRQEDVEYVRSHYNIEDFIYFNHHRRDEHAQLHHFVLNPIFKLHSKMFLKEVLRLSHKTCLYYPLMPAHAESENFDKYSLVTCLADMVPVTSRRQIVYPEKLDANAPSDRVLKKGLPCAIAHTNVKLMHEAKSAINARIVIVGASTVSLAFLERLVFCPHLLFNNLTLISPHGLPGELPPYDLREQMLAANGGYSQADFDRMGLRAWVNVVTGKMTALDRKKKFVIVNDQSIVPYDYLILSTGTQYYLPRAYKGRLATVDTKDFHDEPYLGPSPSNAFVVNDSYDAAVALYWLETNLLNAGKNKVLVYGNTLDAFCCIQALLSLGFTGNRIVFVLPPDQSGVTCFNHPDIDKSVLESVVKAGVQVHQGYVFANWNDGKEGFVNMVTSVNFISTAQPLRVECAAFFCFYHKMVDVQAFKAINDACLVYDGRLVIDAQFHTNDPAVRAAGPLTKYQRVYHADEWTHANFNSKEIGQHLANTLLPFFDPTAQGAVEQAKEPFKLIPMYRSPIIRRAVLPGQLYFLHVTKPRLPTHLELLRSQLDYGTELVTGDVNNTSANYMCVHLNTYRTVESLYCLSKQQFPADNLTCLYGQHERLLNNLVDRYNEGMITDLYSYFSESWALAIFHDRFPDLRSEIRDLMRSTKVDDANSLEEKLLSMIDDDLKLTKEERDELRNDYKKAGLQRAVELRMLGFLNYNNYHLPMYARPNIV